MQADSLLQVKAGRLSDTLGDEEAETLVDMLADLLPEVKAHTLGNVKAEALVDALSNTLAALKSETLGDREAKSERGAV